MIYEYNKKYPALRFDFAEKTLNYNDTERDKIYYFRAKRNFLVLLNIFTLEESKKLTESEIDDHLKKVDFYEHRNSLFHFLTCLNLSQCLHSPKLKKFFDKKDFSIKSLYKIAPRLIIELEEKYKAYIPYEYHELVDFYFIKFCNLGDYIIPSYFNLEKVMNNYINLGPENLKQLGFSEEQIEERKELLEKIKKERETSVCAIICGFIKSFFFVQKKDETKNVKIN